MKLMIFLRGPDLGAWLLDHAVAFSRDARPSRLTVNLNDQPPEVRVHVSSADAAADPYAAVLQLWFDAPDDPSAASEKLDALTADGSLLRHAEGMSAYRIEETEIWNREQRRVGRAPGVTYLGLLDFHADMPDSAARRSWTLHANAARRVHVGCTRYQQNWIAAALTPDTDAARGIAELYFPSRDAIINGFFESERGRTEIRQDIGHFISRGTRLYTSEYVLI
jgi:hypothetical protein